MVIVVRTSSSGIACIRLRPGAIADARGKEHHKSSLKTAPRYAREWPTLLS